MRTAVALSLVVAAALAAPADAQFSTSLGQIGAGTRMTDRPAAPSSPLPIPLPPGVAVQMELDGKDADLIGMVKSLLAGAATPKTGAREDAAAGGAGNPLVTLLGDGQLTALLKDIHHLHVVSFKPADPPAARLPTDFLAFYEKPFVAEGGHRLLYLSSGTPVVTVGFDQPRGFAAVVQSGSMVYVVRADGYPDMAVVGNLLRTFGSAIPTPNLPTAVPAPVPHTSPAHKAVPKAIRAKARRA